LIPTSAIPLTGPNRNRPVDMTYLKTILVVVHWLVQISASSISARRAHWQTDVLTENVTWPQRHRETFRFYYRSDADWIVKLIDVYPNRLRPTGSSGYS